ncbi:cryptochrome-1 isoform X3 [Physcomitrium patens]|uniref:Photolyase/cryptochrome alpha/beta domain-containing protein n=1 Tax=Physcomitrium patens TaxID=3218 RepID=A0A2K1KCC0_PHYPA|nr:cryptochrome-1-like isoform X3 [Physcomitrium patens]PNR51433.1 hypothetical protein PHYPA_010620 [Physcomitrium patens]|eukprot:XP_024380324.1 cryptochrome-1-like isoform X3 [Physcomitrella patens]
MAACTIVWFRRDLRLEDNPALIAAARAGTVVPVFVWSPAEDGQFHPGRVSRWWLKQSLTHLELSLKKLGSPLILRKSPDTLSVLLEIAEATGATQVFYNHLYDPVSLVRDHRVKQGLSQRGIVVHTFNGDLLYEPWEVYDEEGQAFTVYEAFWKKCMSMPFEPEAPLLPPRRLTGPIGKIVGCNAEELGLEDEFEKSSNALLARAWCPGWGFANKSLDSFLRSPLIDYARDRQKADGASGTPTSLLSPHLHFGELSVRKIFHEVRKRQITWAREGNAGGEASVNMFLRALGFREYSRYLSFHFPFTHERSLLANLKSFPWRADEGYFKAWRQGRTGYPLVDAGMRELWATGWAHNRIRVVVASFSVKFLQLPWRWGMKYFWDVLLDADLECDVLGWQYISGSLPDGHELDRIENPEVEGYRFDPDGDYVRRWIPELARLPNEWVHHPWDAPPSALRAAGVELGTNYPRPIVEIGAARERLQASLAEMWERDAAMKAALANGLEEGLGETVEVAGTGGPEHERMDVPRVMVHMQRDADMSCNSSRRDQLVPEIVPNQFHIRAHESIMNRSAAMVEDGEEAGRAAVPMVFASVRRGMGGNYGGHHVEGNGGEVAQASAPIQWPTVTAVDYELDSTAESASVTGRGGSEGGTVPVWSQSVSARTPIQVREGLVPEVRRGPGLSRRQLQASVQRVNLEGMTSNKTSSLSV